MEILKKLIQIKSITGGEKGVKDYILNLLVSCGLTPIVFKGNIILVIKGENQQKCLMFNAHIDTVSCGNISLWNKDPYLGHESSGKMYGLGASDNKASVASLLILAKQFSVKTPDCDVVLTFTINEEVDGSGTNDTVNYLSSKHLKVYKKISAIVCEPTGLIEIGIAHKGNIFLKITTMGKSGHGSIPIKTEDHSVIKMYKVIQNIEKLSQDWVGKYYDNILGIPTIGLATSISAGQSDTPNKFPDKCTATFDIRTVPKMHDYAFKQVKKAVGLLGKVEYLFPPVPFAYTNPTSEIVKVFKQASKAKIVAFSGSSDMPFFTQKDIPTVIFGPGEASQMHKPNEFCYVSKIDECVLIFKKVIQEFARIE